MNEFKATPSETFGSMQPTEFVSVGAPVKMEFVCSKCGGTRFRWVATEGKIKAGGFVPDAYLYACLGCGKEYSEADYKKFFQTR
jgi:DNA-directed RNA polymerase subunit RPC12/RpoP